jgi:Flp pilus assembly pilin Flp
MFKIKYGKKSGQGMVEYALLLAVVALAVVLVLNTTGVSISDVFCRIAGSLGGGPCAETGCTLAFDDPAELDSWNARDAKNGNLNVEDGQLCNMGNQMNYFAACAEGGFDGGGYGDFTATLDGIKIDNYNNDLHPGFDFVFRADSNGNGYWLSYSANANRVLFWKQVNGVRILLDSAPVPAEMVNEELNIVLKAEGNTFSAYRDDQLILETSDDAYDSGIFGWRNKPGSSTCINEMVIQ